MLVSEGAKNWAIENHVSEVVGNDDLKTGKNSYIFIFNIIKTCFIQQNFALFNPDGSHVSKISISKFEKFIKMNFSSTKLCILGIATFGKIFKFETPISRICETKSSN